MEEIKINLSTKLWVAELFAILATCAVLVGISYYVRGLNSALEMLGIFLLGMVGSIIPKFISNRNRLVITDTSLTVKTQEEWVVQFSGVDSFYVDKFKGRTFVGIRYKDNVEECITDDEIAQNRKLRSRAALQGYPYEIYVKGLSKTPQEICNILNQRLNS